MTIREMIARIEELGYDDETELSFGIMQEAEYSRDENFSPPFLYKRLSDFEDFEVNWFDVFRDIIDIGNWDLSISLTPGTLYTSTQIDIVKNYFNEIFEKHEEIVEAICNEIKFDFNGKEI